jgi:type II secretory ATPase GspE/PulE/Tfp pilus assembly ATPase PilB-like protein
MIRNGKSQDDIAEKVFEQRKQSTLFQDGAKKILQGLTTMEEVRRVTYLAEGD